MTSGKLFERRADYREPLLLILLLFAILIPIWIFTNQFPWSENVYNSYELQAQSWLNGRLDVDYTEHLELAEYGGRYYVSFPPFPSYLMLLPVLLFGHGFDGWLQLLASCMGLYYTYRLTCEFTSSRERRMLFTILVFLGSNVLFNTASNGWVWFLAQNLGFALSMMGLYYGCRGQIGRAMFCVVAAAGCRPFMTLCLPAVIYMLRIARQNEAKPLKQMLAEGLVKSIPALLLGLSYMLLNWLRFGNVFEFGHNYLEEFMSYEHGQFHISYLLPNLKSLIRLPYFENGRLVIPAFNGICIFLVSPVFGAALIYWLRAIIRRSGNVWINLMIPLLTLIHLLLLCSHATMGGYHFGNRYTNDLLPLVYLGLLWNLGGRGLFERLLYPAAFFGILINALGTVAYFTGLI